MRPSTVRWRRWWVSLIVLIVFSAVYVAFSPGGASALLSSGYDLSWWTIGGGGGISSSENYTVKSTIGQPDAGRLMSGGDYTLVGGFWPGAGAASDRPRGHKIFLPVVLR